MTSPALPRHLPSVVVPPIKCQGIKTKGWCLSSRPTWLGTPAAAGVEPFLGSGVVAFNLAPQRAVLADSNRHIIAFYQAVQQGRITHEAVRTFWKRWTKNCGEAFYYAVRERFNRRGDSLDLLFLNRASFNGVMRFNRQGKFNVPFGKKVERFRPAYVTKIANQVRRLEQILQGKDWQLVTADWHETLSLACAGDFVSLDPP